MQPTEEQLRFVSDHAPVLIAHCDGEFRYLFVNKPYAERFGLRPEDFIGRTIAEVLGEEAFKAIKPHGERALRGEAVEFEALLTYQGLGERYVHARYVPETDAAGVTRSFLAAITDVTEKRHADLLLRQQADALIATQARLQASELQLREMTDALPALIGFIDAEGRYRFVNKQYQIWFGKKADEIVGREVREILGEAAVQKLWPQMQRALRGENVRFEMEVPYRVIGTRWVDIAYVPRRTPGGAVDGFLVLVTDITERKNAERALRESEQRYRTLMEQAHDGIFVLDDKARFLLVNRAACAMLGYSAEELQGREVSLTYVAEEQKMAEERRQKIQSHGHLRFERKVRRKDGSVFDAEVSVNLLPNGLAHATARDITKRKRTEFLLEAQKQSLEMVVTGEPLGQILSHLAHVAEVNAESAALASILVLDGAGILRNGASPGLPSPFLDSITGQAGHASGPAGAAVATNSVVVVPDFERDPGLAPLTEVAQSIGLRSGWARPIHARDGSVLGTFSTYFKECREPGDAERQVVEILARTAALAIERSRDEAAIRERARTLEIFNRVSGLLVAELDLEKIVQAVTDAGREIAGAAFGAFFYNLKNERGESYTLYTLSGAPRSAFEKFPMPRNTQMFGPTFRGEGVIRIDDVLKDPRYGKNAPYHGMPKGHLPVRSYLAVPVMSRSGDVLGGLFFGHPAPGVFTAEAEKMMTSLGAQAAIAIDNANLYQAVQRELAEHKRAEEALRESEGRFRMIADNIATLAWTADRLGWATWYNQRWYEYTGTTFDDMKERGWEVLQHPDHAARVDRTLREALEREEIWEDTFPLRGRDGTYRWFLSRAIPIRNAEGKVVRWFGTNTDVTELRAAQEALRAAQEKLQEHAKELERTVAERTASLREAMAQMEEFSYSVSHDLRAPIRAMKGYAQILAADYSDRLGAEGNDFLERIIRGGDRMEKLTHDVLAMSRLARTAMELAPIDLDRMLREILQHYPDLQNAGAHIHIEPLHPVVGHESSLMQTISNLLGNAVKFVAPGTVPRVRVWTEVRGENVRLWFEDNGIGIRPEHQRRIFMMFERLNAAEQYDGTGVGLAIVRKAVERMNGTVGVESDGVNGSRFWIELPGPGR
jgi:PAS domain S-box-containing protein